MKAIDRAVRYLNIKPRTEYQIRKHLREKGCEEGEICHAIDQLKEYNYIDDLAFASMYFELGFEKGHGEVRIRRELAEKGVRKDIIDEACSSLEIIPDQYEMALEIGKTVVESTLGVHGGQTDAIKEMSYEERQKLQAKVARRIAGRGFGGDIAYRVAREVTR